MSDLQRIEHLRKMVKSQEENPKKHTETVRWRGENYHLSVIRVETSFLRYRLENGRTRRKQIEYLQNNPDAPSDLFNDPESNEAQEAQNIILLDLINEKGLKDDLLTEGQRKPAIITYDGYVLNGNRRLAALKENKIQHMDCVVLPEDSNPKDLYELELDLQMARDTKAEYNWVDVLLHIRYGIEDLKEEKSNLTKKMRLGKKEIESKISMLFLVDLYLDWLNKPKQYHIVGAVDEQAFKELENMSRN